MNIATAVLKYSGGISLTTATDFWIFDNKIGYIVTNDQERYNLKNNVAIITQHSSTTNAQAESENIVQESAQTSIIARRTPKIYNEFTSDKVYIEGVEAFMKRDYETAFDKIQSCANRNNVTAQRLVGYCYRMGYGVEKNLSKAKFWYKKAADAGDEYAAECFQTLLDDEKIGRF
ncbi:MAG: SEL1-like repeat protein [Bacteroidales bacterium]|nr:SEL1-like repeat protein [Bacteroidales bacterium]